MTETPAIETVDELAAERAAAASFDPDMDRHRRAAFRSGWLASKQWHHEQQEREIEVVKARLRVRLTARLEAAKES